jgi:hypothetical protein
VVTPTTVNRTVAPSWRPNADLRRASDRAEVERLIAAAKCNRHGHRDATMILVAYSMASGRPNWLTCTGNKSTSEWPSSGLQSPTRTRSCA